MNFRQHQAEDLAFPDLWSYELPHQVEGGQDQLLQDNVQGVQQEVHGEADLSVFPDPWKLPHQVGLKLDQVLQDDIQGVQEKVHGEAHLKDHGEADLGLASALLA